MSAPAGRGPRSGRSTAAGLGWTAAALAAGAALAGLGVWQVHRLHWKLDLIARVEQRVHARALDMPGRAEWAGVSAARDEYRHVRARGTWLYGHNTLVQASTERGSGYWVLTPLQTDHATCVLVNRGFVPPQAREAMLHEHGAERAVEITGLLRMSEPQGAFLRHNDAVHERWYSRDVAAIAAARGLGPVAPFFIDQDGNARTAREDQGPVAGMTVIAFPNHHLLYAIIWFSLALMAVAAAWLTVRDVLGLRRR